MNAKRDAEAKQRSEKSVECVDPIAGPDLGKCNRLSAGRSCMINDVPIGTIAFNLVSETYERGDPFRIFLTDDLVKRIAAPLPNGVPLLRNDHGPAVVK